jgi:transmembrane sensor
VSGDDADLYSLAARHWARVESGDATPADRAAMERWCAQSPAHRAAMDAVAAGWDRAGAVEEDDALAEMMAQMRARHPRRRRLWPGALLAASLAAVLIVPAAYWLSHRRDGDAAGPVVAGNALASAAGTPLSSAAGHRRSMTLPDGSRVVLDADSAIRVAYSAGERAVFLDRGRAYFAVAKNPARPFRVSTDQLSVTAVGTAFDVSRLSASEQVLTTEGVVRVVAAGATGSARLLPAGQRLTRNGASLSVEAVDLMRESAWRDGRIVFTGRCLSDVAEQMNRYASGRLVVTPTAGALAISGVFAIDNADGLAEALEQQGLVRVDRRADRIVLSRGEVVPAGGCSHAG